MTIELTESEIKTLRVYLDQALIELKGLRAIGLKNNTSIKNVESIKKKISQQNLLKENNYGI